jgi:hypothetical protein
MNNQTPRQQLEDIMYEGLFDIAHMPLPDDREATKNEMIAAILAVFKGLTAMQEEHLSQDDPRQRFDTEPFEWAERNTLRRQILAELEGE